MFRQYRLLIASILYLACCLLLYPYYSYIFDDDGIGYMMVARRLAGGDWHNAVNGYWSPLHSWIVVPLIKSGMTEITAFRISNWIIGLLILVWVHRLSNKTGLSNQLKAILLMVCIPIAIHYAIYEVAADVLFCWLALVYTDIITEKDFFEKPRLNLLCGVVAALLYFSKAYAFPFFLLHFTLVQGWFYFTTDDPGKMKWLLRNMALGIGSFLLLSAPWIWTLYEKYDEFTFGYSGRLNQDVHLYSRQLTSNALVYPPPYPDSPGSWEDPWFIPMQRTPGEHFFRADILVKQVRLFLTNVIRALEAFGYLSCFTMATLLCMGIYLMLQKNRVLFLFLLTCAVLPAGYLLVFIEPRYIWPVSLILLVSGAFLLNIILSCFQIKGKRAALCWALFFGSFLVSPINQLKDAVNGNQELFQLAAFAEEKNIRGRYLCSDNADYSMVPKLAFLTHSSTWTCLQPDRSYEEHLSAMRENHIGYYFFRYNSTREMQWFMQSPLYKAAFKVHDPGLYNLVILEIK